MESKDIIKKLIRDFSKEKEATFSDKYKINSNTLITQNLLSLNQYRAAKVIFTFVGTKTEIDTMPFITIALSQGKRIAVPKCEGKGIMTAYEIKSIRDLEAGKYEIMEPKSSCNIINKNEIDLAVVPCVAADKMCRRLGHGGGYYDRYMEETAFYKALICREELLRGEVPAEPHDILCNCLITEKGIYF